MSEKNLDAKGRWRNVTIAFRVSPAENEDINRRVQLSGLTKQEYLTRCCQNREVIITGNPRVFKAMKSQLKLLNEELCRIDAGTSVDNDLLDTIRFVTEVLFALNQDQKTEVRD